jgi:signal transduction histidine kinase
MKSPVTAIRGRLELALSTTDEGHSRELVAEAVDGLDRLSHMLTTTLDLAEAEAGALHLNRESVDFSILVQQQIDLYHPAFATHNHRLSCDLTEHVFIDADVSLIQRVVNNLIDNELAHLPGGCDIRVCLDAQDQQVELVIEDNGPGFPPDLRNHAFERFVKGKISRGRGLGLAFVNAVVQAHGGSVKLSHPVGGGVAIRISLPPAIG